VFFSEPSGFGERLYLLAAEHYLGLNEQRHIDSARLFLGSFCRAEGVFIAQSKASLSRLAASGQTSTAEVPTTQASTTQASAAVWAATTEAARPNPFGQRRVVNRYGRLIDFLSDNGW